MDLLYNHRFKNGVARYKNDHEKHKRKNFRNRRKEWRSKNAKHGFIEATKSVFFILCYFRMKRLQG